VPCPPEASTASRAVPGIDTGIAFVVVCSCVSRQVRDLLPGNLLGLLADLPFLVSHSRRRRSFSLANSFAYRSRERALIHHTVTDWHRFAQPPELLQTIQMSADRGVDSSRLKAWVVTWCAGLQPPGSNLTASSPKKTEAL